MKEEFKRTMLYIFPKGVGGNKHQFRTLCKVFCMGWWEALKTRSPHTDRDEELDILKAMSDFNWWPDSSWEWWN